MIIQADAAISRGVPTPGRLRGVAHCLPIVYVRARRVRHVIPPLPEIDLRMGAGLDN